MDHKVDKDYLDNLVKEKSAMVYKGMKILIIGGTGFIGFNLIKKLKI